MKKFCFLIVIFSFLVITSTFNVSAKEIVIDRSQKVEEYNESFMNNYKKIIDDGVIVLETGFTIFKGHNIEGKVVSIKEHGDCSYVVCILDDQSYIYKINDLVQIIAIVEAKLNDLIVFDDFIYAVGVENNNACIYKISFDKELLYRKIYDSSYYSEFTNVFSLNNHIYIIGVKNGFGEYPFKNVGNELDKKSFIISINEDYEFEKECYFNEHFEYEFVSSLFVDEDINLILECSGYLFFYRLNSDLEVIKRVDLCFLNDSKTQILKDNLLLYNDTSSLCLYDLNNKESVIIDNYYPYELAKINSGNLEIFSKQQNQICKTIYKEYHVIYKDDFYYKYPYSDYKQTKHFKIESYFEPLDFKYNDSKNASIDLQTSKEYICYYSAVKLNGEIIDISTKYNVLSFVNIIDKGVYKKGYKLIFTDKLKLDGEYVYNGAVLDVGDHQIEHNSKVYSIHVCEDDSFFEQSHLYEDACLSLVDSYNLSFQLDDVSRVNSVIVNGSEYPFRIIDSSVVISFYHTDELMKTYNVERVLFDDGLSLELQKTYYVRSLYSLPTFAIDLLDETVLVDVVDEKKTVFDVFFRLHNKDSFIDKHTYLANSSIELSGSKDVEVFIRVFNGKEVEDVLLSNLSFKDIDKSSIFKVSFEGDSIKLKLEPSKQTKVDSFNVLDKNIVSLYSTKSNKIIIYVSAILSILAIGGIIYVVFSRKKHSKCDK